MNETPAEEIGGRVVVLQPELGEQLEHELEEGGGKVAGVMSWERKGFARGFQEEN